MKHTAFVMLVVSVFAIAVFGAKGSGTKDSQMLSAEDQSAVRANVNRFADAWNRHDMNAMHDLDTDDVDWINIVGQHWEGKTTVFKGHTAIHKGMCAKQSMSVESVSVRPLAPTVAIAVATMHFSASTDPRYSWVKASKTRGTFTMVKRDGLWKIAHFQNTVMDPRAETEDVPSFDKTGFPPPGEVR